MHTSTVIQRNTLDAIENKAVVTFAPFKAAFRTSEWGNKAGTVPSTGVGTHLIVTVGRAGSSYKTKMHLLDFVCETENCKRKKYEQKYCSAYLTAERAAPPWLDFDSFALAGQSVGLDTVTQSVFVAIQGTNIKHAIRQVCRWVNFTVADFERPIGCNNDATGVCCSVQVGLGRLTYGTLASTASTHITRQVHRPCFPKLIDVFSCSATGKHKIIAVLLVVVAAKAAHFSLVRGRNDHLNVIDSVVQDRQSKVGADDNVLPFLGDSEEPVVEREGKV